MDYEAEQAVVFMSALISGCEGATPGDGPSERAKAAGKLCGPPGPPPDPASPGRHSRRPRTPSSSLSLTCVRVRTTGRRPAQATVRTTTQGRPHARRNDGQATRDDKALQPPALSLPHQAPPIHRMTRGFDLEGPGALTGQHTRARSVRLASPQIPSSTGHARG